MNDKNKIEVKARNKWLFWGWMLVLLQAICGFSIAMISTNQMVQLGGLTISLTAVGVALIYRQMIKDRAL